MKRINRLIVFGLLLMSAWSCKKEIVDVVINPNAVLLATVSTPTAVLLKDNALKDAFSVNWTSPDYGFQAAPGYTVYLDKKGNDFKKALVFSVGSDLKKSFNTAALNNALISMGILPNTTADMEIKVEALVGTATKLTSTILNLKATPYLDKLDLSTTWGVVGSATPNGWNGPDLPVYKTGTQNEFVAYATLIAGAIKFRVNNDWAVNLGGVGGVLSANGPDITVTPGTYKITFNPVALTYKIVPFTWGIVGDGTANGWNGPDQMMMYDATVDLWRTILTVVADGSIKFRLNNDWGTNYGAASGADGDPILVGGALAAGGKNFGVKKGTYLVTMDPVTLKYTFAAYKSWGLVGDATPGGWNGPDQAFTYDLSTKKWFLNNVTLTAASVKFRENNDWANNLGATGTVEPLPIGTAGALTAGGKNFGVTAGIWSFELDLTDAANPKYKATKK